MTTTAYIIETDSTGSLRIERTATGRTAWIFVDDLEVGQVRRQGKVYVAESFDPADIEDGCSRCGFTNQEAAINFLTCRQGFLYPR